MLRRLQTVTCIYQHLRKMLCCTFTYDHQNYYCWDPVYIAEMLLLPETTPEVNTKFQEGEHVVKRSENTSYNTVWS